MTVTNAKAAAQLRTPAHTRAAALPDHGLAGRLLHTTEPFALIARHGNLEYLTGDVVDVDRLADIPLHNAGGVPQQVLALVPFAQIAERGYPVHPDDAPLRCLITREAHTAPAGLLDHLPGTPVKLTDRGFTTSDAEYERLVARVIDDEIGTGQGANFVIRRDFTARFTGADRLAALGFFRALCEHERGAYWTFCIAADDVVLVGASPEAHVRMTNGSVTMNPISGTLRHTPGATDQQHHAALLEFLASQKEREELFMVVDEEMKMMSTICPDGGRISGPYLKPMSKLTHTEYELHGHTDLAPTDVLRETMFAPTVTGSPMQNACSVIAKYEDSPRGYYSGVAALFTPNAEGGHDLDAPILIRTAQLRAGRLRVSAGATLVRHSTPDGEAAETVAKTAGVLGAIGALPAGRAKAGAQADVELPVPAERTGSGMSAQAPTADPGGQADVQARRLLAARNATLGQFWMQQQSGTPARRPFAGHSALLVDAEDRFTAMLAHQLRHLGLDVTVVVWDQVTDLEAESAELLVAGPGPGDPTADDDIRIARMSQLVSARLAAHTPLLTVCLSHQILCRQLGFDVAKLAEPRQGVQLGVSMFGALRQVGFYNTFGARVSPGTIHAGGAEVAADPTTGDVFALRGIGFASVQGHLESVLSHDGLTALTRMVAHVLG